MSLTEEIIKLRKSPIKAVVENRLNEFEELGRMGNEKWFSELCFCMLTANSRAKSAIAIQKELGYNGFSEMSESEISSAIKRNKHRFHNNKAKFICESRKYKKIKNILSGKTESDAREWLVKNVKGLGYKEASHFLRNVGYKNLAILDRHILNLMAENSYLNEKPKSLNKKNYIEIENKFGEISKSTNMSNAELDLYMWYMKTGEVLK